MISMGFNCHDPFVLARAIGANVVALRHFIGSNELGAMNVFRSHLTRDREVNMTITGAILFATRQSGQANHDAVFG